MESFSNLAYSLVGFIGLHPYFIRYNGVLFCALMQALSVASFTYHWQKTKPIFLFDWWAMVFVITIITGNAVDQLWCWAAVFLYQIIYAYLIMGKINVFIEVGMAIIPCLIAIWIERGFVDFIVVLLSILLALWIRSKDEDPTQAKVHDSIEHSIWHVLTAPIFFVGFFGLELILNFLR